MAGLGASPNSVSKLIQLLAAEHKNFTSIEIAETLWLAMQIEPVATVVPSVVPVSKEGEEPVVATPELIDDEREQDFTPDPPPLPLSTPAPKADIAAAIPQAGILPPQTLPVWLADPAMLKDSLAIVRALKPLLQKVSVGIGKRLDESATVDNIARTRLCSPIMQPEQEPLFDIILVVDRGSSMHIWQRLVKDIVRILRHYGAFRDVQVFDLVVDKAGGSTTNAVQLISKPQRPSHRSSELIDQSGRRIVIVLSDCAGVYWWDGTLLPMLQEWGKVMPTVVWQMLPAWMWKRTALGRGTAVAINNDIPGAANQRLQVEIQERGAPDYDGQRMPVPVMTSEVRDLVRWSLMVAGDSRAVTPGFLLPKVGGLVPRSQSIEELAGDHTRQMQAEGTGSSFEDLVTAEIEKIAGDRVQRFLELASPEAQRLIALLSAAPVITLPVVRLIRDAMLYDVQSPLPVAEAFLSGLLQRLPGQEDLQGVLEEHTKAAEVELKTDGQDLAAVNESELVDMRDLVQYDFVPNVRKILLKVLPPVDTIEVINSVSAAVESRWHRFSRDDFRAFLTNPNLEAPKGLSGLRSFANVTADILESLGGDYASFAEQLRVGSGEKTPTDNPDDKSNYFPLEDLPYEAAKFIDFPPLQICNYESVTIEAIQDRFDFETAKIERQSGLLGLRAKWRIDRRPGVAWGYTENLLGERAEEVGLDMIAIPGGSFMMGHEPQHDATLQPFYLGRYLITQAQWRVVAGYDQINKELNPEPSRFIGDNLPVGRISWEDAQAFCQWLSTKNGKNYRLPSEAEWEYACRAGTVTPFHFGETITSELANYDGSATYNDEPKGKYRGKTTAVGTFPANDWGLHDMHGNVWEWCEDDWHGSYEGAPADDSPWVDADRTDRKLLRGGSWNFVPRYCRSANRYSYARDNAGNDVGFRVCCEPLRILLST
jgi:formylglycine-generating enzyme required for sulfatase activity